MKSDLLILIASSCLFIFNAFAGTAADTVDLSLLNSEQSKIIQFELNTFSEIANSKITSENKNKYEKNLQQIIYCGYDVFSGDQSQFARITESNERLIFNTPTLMAKYQLLDKTENKLPTNPAICEKLQN